MTGKCVRALCAMAALSVLGAGAARSAAAQRAEEKARPRAVANDNRTPAGHLANGVLELRLELRAAVWYPEEENGGHLNAYAFAEEGGPPQITGPMIRVPQGTQLRVHVKNSLPLAAKVYGLHAHPGDPQEAVALAPGESRDLQFSSGAPGSYYYWATTSGKPLELRDQDETLLSGAFIVDPPGTNPGDRVLVISIWTKGNAFLDGEEVPAVNGRSWPYSERLTYNVGETVHWRVINPSFSAHAMHLHGFHFTVEAVGDGEHYEKYSAAERRLAVTEKIEPGHAFELSWTPTRAGNWLFHCHMVVHMMPSPTLHPQDAAHAVDVPVAATGPGATGAGMGGLVVGVTILPTGNAGSDAAVSAPPKVTRKLELIISDNPRKVPLYSLKVVDPAGPPPPPAAPAIPGFPDPSVPLLGPPIFVTRGEPTEIEVKNQSSQPTAIHWHGIELESYYDGVAGWTGNARQTTPPIPPGTSFTARMAPPRAGTFIYHTHWHDADQLVNALYGPLIVLEPGQKFDAQREKIFLLSVGSFPPLGNLYLINGSPQPLPETLETGTTYRFRFINITDNDVAMRARLVCKGAPAEWKMVAKDGADLPAGRVRMSPAEIAISVGETYDVEFRAAVEGEVDLEVWDADFPVRVVAPLIFTAAK